MAISPILGRLNAVVTGPETHRPKVPARTSGRPFARRFVRRHSRELGALPVWLFSSGRLGDAEQQSEILPVRGVARLIRALVVAPRQRSTGLARAQRPSR